MVYHVFIGTFRPKGANKNMVDHAIFSKDGPNLNNPAETKRPSVIPNKYRLKKRNAKGRPSFSKDIPNKGEVNRIAILLTSPLFGISLLKLGLPLAFLFLSLYLFGITLGLFVSAGLLRFGPSFENIAWSTMFLLAPFGRKVPIKTW